MNKFHIGLFTVLAAQLFSGYGAANCDDDSYPVSKTKYGEVRGVVLKSRKGKSFAAFRGIPYAEPPVGELRFKAPVEVSKWKGVRNATEDATVCIQQDFLFKRDPVIEGSEDCLYINVYSSKALCETRTGKLLPVMVFIHYGAFLAGNSRSDVIGPEYLMDNDIILVTFNYRLGIMGFFSTHDDEAPGNWAFKDQVAALKWVKANIHYFGGNNKKITLAGQSAGAGSVHHLMLSPSSKGLFQGAISLSGSALALWAKPMPKEVNFVVANLTALSVGCVNANTKTMVECLRNVSAYDLVDAAKIFRQFIESEPLTPYFAAIEEKTERNPEPFITEEPINIIRKGNFLNIPWMIGAVSGEGILRAAPFIRRQDTMTKINSNFDVLKDFSALGLSVEPRMVDVLWMQVKDFYFNGGNNLNSTSGITGLIDFYSDRAFLYPTYQTMKIHKRHGHKHIFVYNFNYKGRYTYGDLFAGTPNDIDYNWGVSHCDDLLYLLNSPGRFTNYELTEVDMKVSEIMLDFFINFIKYRDPTPQHLWGNRQRWEELPNTTSDLSDENLQYLDISGGFEEQAYHLNMTNGFYTNRMNFWRSKPIGENLYFNNFASTIK